MPPRSSSPDAMETEVKLTKLASCAGCGAKMGAGTLAKMLEGFKAHSDPRLIVGYDKSDDASVYVLDENTALIHGRRAEAGAEYPLRGRRHGG